MRVYLFVLSLYIFKFSCKHIIYVVCAKKNLILYKSSAYKRYECEENVFL
jgi:hypothetical protein